jgi:hypothetical protein
MKKNLIIPAIFTFLIIYLLFAFVTMELNPVFWKDNFRLAFVCFSIISFGGSLLLKEAENK